MAHGWALNFEANMVKYLLLFLVSCSTIQQIDKPVCVEVNMSKGYCTTIISGKDQIVDEVNLLYGKTWFEARVEMVLVPIETWAALKTYLITECKRTKRCGDKIQTWEKSLQNVELNFQKKSSLSEGPSESHTQDFPSSSPYPSKPNNDGNKSEIQQTQPDL